MKKIHFISVIIISLLIVGCESGGNLTNKLQEENNVPEYKSSSADIIDMHGEIENKERFMEFLNTVNKGKEDSIRVVNYTTEGDPMLHNLEYDGQVITSTRDTRRDMFGNGSINTTTCTSIEVVDSTERTNYILEGCKNSNVDVLILATWK